MRIAMLSLCALTLFSMGSALAESASSVEAEAFFRMSGPALYCNDSADSWDYAARATYLVIAADLFFDNNTSGLADFMNWKREKGLKVIGTRLSNIPHTGSVVTTANVQSYIRAVYNGDPGFAGLPPLQYVLLVGECNLLSTSARDSVNVSSVNNEVPTNVATYGTVSFASDQPYINSLTKDAIGNPINREFYEYEGVVIGRISAETLTQSALIFNKILTYETNPPAGSWPEQFIGACYFEDQNPVPVDGMSENPTPDIVMTIYQILTRHLGYNSNGIDKIVVGKPNGYTRSAPYYFSNYTAPQHFKNVQLHAWNTGEFSTLNSNYMPTPIPLRIQNLFYPYGTAHDAVNTALNDGVSSLMFSGHGCTNGLGWSRFEYYTTRSIPWDMSGLQNDYRLPVFFSMVCQTGSFAENNYHPDDPNPYTNDWRQCMCEAFLRYNSGATAGPGGAVAAVGCSYGSDGAYAFPIMYGLYSALEGRDFDPTNWDNTASPSVGGLGELGVPTQRPAVALAWAKCWMAHLLNIPNSTPDVYTKAKQHWEMMNYFGDPELMMLTHIPATLTVQHPTVLSAVGHFTATVTSGGTAVPNARVALVHLVGGNPDPDEEPWVTITDAQGAADILVLPTSGSYQLTVTGANCRPYTAILTTNFSTYNVPSQYATIQQAINAAPTVNAVIRVAAGTYSSAALNGKHIVIRSLQPRSPAVVAQTIIVPPAGSYGVRLNGTEDTRCAIAGLTIQGCQSVGVGSVSGAATAGVFYNKIQNNTGTDYVYGIQNVAGEIAFNQILNNDGSIIGSGIRGCDGHIHHNEIYGNDGVSYGYGIRISNGLIEFNDIYNNGGDSGRGLSDCNGTIRCNRIHNNTGTSFGYGIRYCNGIIEHNVIYNNDGPSYSAGLYACNGALRHNTVYGHMYGIRACTSTSITNCIAWGSSISAVSTSTIPTYSCIQNWTGGGTGNIVTNPLFLNAASGDYRIQYISPCLNSAANLNLTEDFFGHARPQGTAADRGAIEYCY